MNPFNRVFARLARPLVLALVGVTLVLAGCSGQSVKEKQQAAHFAKEFKVVVKAYKDGQFTLDGAVLSEIDLSSHFSYLRDQGRLPHKVLLLRTDETAIGKKHLQAMARMSLDYGFRVYYDRDGELLRIEANTGNAAHKLEGTPKKHGHAGDHGHRHDGYAPDSGDGDGS